MKYVLSIDPGMSTGITLGRFTAISPYERLDYWQIEGGLPGLREWFKVHDLQDEEYGHSWLYGERRQEVTDWNPVVVCEKFVPLPAPRSFKLAELEPIRIEGVIEDRFGDSVVWQRPSAMVLAGGETPAERKRNSDDILRRGGLWLTGKKDLGLKDANDVNAAQKHALAYMTRINHQPTIEKYRVLED